MSYYKECLSIVLAEDDEDDILFFKEALMDLPLEINLKCLHDGQELMGYLHGLEEDQIPDLLFLDINMPCKNGIDCVSEIRQDETYNAVPIIMFTESGNQNKMLETRKCGANRYLKKPGTFKALVSILSDLLSDEGYRSLHKNKRYLLS